MRCCKVSLRVHLLVHEASFGGIVEGSPGTGHYLTTPEVAWVVQELERRNQALCARFLQSDDFPTADRAL